jgi:glutathione S-transferase
MLKLYGRKNTGSAAVEALLVLVGAPHVMVDVAKEPDGSAPPWYLAINPCGEVPALELEDHSIMTESAALMIYLADRFSDAGLAPAVSAADRAQYLRWMVYLAAVPYATDLRMYYAPRYSINPDHAEAIKQKAIIDLNRDFDVFAGALGEGPFVLGERFSAVDIYAAMLFSWSEDMAALFKRQPKLARLFDAVAARPGMREVWERHGIV